MTIKRFWDDPYRCQLETRVSAVSEELVRLEETIIFAEPGGQESDQGSIAGHTVLEARWQDHDIIYALDPGHGLVAGDAVTVHIDWPRRYRLMRLHFAAEMVLELVHRKLSGIEKIGAHISAEKARIDFALPCSLAPALPELESAAALWVTADRAITSEFEDRVLERRFWEVTGLARVPCGGTHLRRTSEVGALKLKRRNVGRGKERIEISLASP